MIELISKQLSNPDKIYPHPEKLLFEPDKNYPFQNRSGLTQKVLISLQETPSELQISIYQLIEPKSLLANHQVPPQKVRVAIKTITSALLTDIV